MEYLDLMEEHRKLKASREQLFQETGIRSTFLVIQLIEASIEIREKRWM